MTSMMMSSGTPIATPATLPASCRPAQRPTGAGAANVRSARQSPAAPTDTRNARTIPPAVIA
jgi:hypothetical protein